MRLKIDRTCILRGSSLALLMGSGVFVGRTFISLMLIPIQFGYAHDWTERFQGDLEGTVIGAGIGLGAHLWIWRRAGTR
jgi:hypothetical protein